MCHIAGGRDALPKDDIDYHGYEHKEGSHCRKKQCPPVYGCGRRRGKRDEECLGDYKCGKQQSDYQLVNETRICSFAYQLYATSGRHESTPNVVDGSGQICIFDSQLLHISRRWHKNLSPT